MGRKGAILVSGLSLLLFLFLGSRAAASQAEDPWKPVAEALGRSGEEQDGVYRVTFPRSDLRIRVAGANIRPALALTSWCAFQRAGGGTMVMGDLVLQTPEVSPVVSKLAEVGIEITAIHNHLTGEAPRVTYLHFHGHGDARRLATVLREVLVLTGTPLATPRPRAGEEPTLDAERLGRILGYRGVARGGVLAFSIPRAERITRGGATLSPRMGVATVINFQTEGSGAVTTGDFVLLAGEVQAVIRALRQYGLEVTALHNHMLDEQPRLFFLHFWGRGSIEQLARGLRAALDQTRHTAP